MPSRFEQRFQAHAIPVLNREFSVNVVYSQGSLVTEPFRARRGDREYSSIGQEFKLEVTVMMRDFWLPVASLVIDGRTIKPQAGDRIIEGAEAFEVSPPSESQSACELLPGDFEWLVHCKRLEFSNATGRGYRG